MIGKVKWFSAEKGSSTDCSVIANEKFRAITALDGTTGVLLSVKEANDDINPINKKKPASIAIRDPINVAATIFRKFFIFVRIDLMLIDDKSSNKS